MNTMVGRRQLLRCGSVALAAGALTSACDSEETNDTKRSAADGSSPMASPRFPEGADWEAVRGQFALSQDPVHMSALLISSHPATVRAAIEEHRRGLDADPVTYLEANNDRLHGESRAAAARYLGTEGEDIALTDSTTMGIGLVYNGLRLSEGDEILSTENDYYATDEALRLAAARSGAEIRSLALYDDIGAVSEDAIAGRIAQAVTPRSRALAVTWVHSNTGLKLPLPRIAEALEEVNAEREEAERVLFCVDGVHGFGVEDAELGDLGCDFLMAGCHKWLFGPRGTGIVAGRSEAWRRLRPTIPSFTDDRVWLAWLEGREPASPPRASTMTPGGFKAFEHYWALPPAFALHESIGKDNVAARTHELADQLKQGLAEIAGITLHTPRAAELSAGIVAFDVDGVSAGDAVARLRERRLIASVTPYAHPHVRLTPSIRNSREEIEFALREVRALVG